MVLPIDFPFDRSVPYTFEDFLRHEDAILVARRADDEFSGQLRLCTLPWMKLRSEEVYPAWYFCRHTDLPRSTCFVISAEGSPVDIQIRTSGRMIELQITTAGPVWNGERNWGADHKRGIRLLNRNGHASGIGPFRLLSDGEIADRDCAISTAERDPPFRKGIVAALRGKQFQRGDSYDLLVHCTGYDMAMSYEDFKRIAAEAFSAFPLTNFRAVHIQSSAIGYLCSFTASRLSRHVVEWRAP